MPSFVALYVALVAVDESDNLVDMLQVMSYCWFLCYVTGNLRGENVDA